MGPPRVGGRSVSLLITLREGSPENSGSRPSDRARRGHRSATQGLDRAEARRPTSTNHWTLPRLPPPDRERHRSGIPRSRPSRPRAAAAAAQPGDAGGRMQVRPEPSGRRPAGSGERKRRCARPANHRHLRPLVAGLGSPATRFWGSGGTTRTNRCCPPRARSKRPCGTKSRGSGCPAKIGSER